MKKFLLLYGVYSNVDFELFIDCLGVYDSWDEAYEAMEFSQEEDEDDGEERKYKIQEINL